MLTGPIIGYSPCQGNSCSLPSTQCDSAFSKNYIVFLCKLGDVLLSKVESKKEIVSMLGLNLKGPFTFKGNHISLYCF